VRGTSLAICSRVCLVRGPHVFCADHTKLRRASSSPRTKRLLGRRASSVFRVFRVFAIEVVVHVVVHEGGERLVRAGHAHLVHAQAELPELAPNRHGHSPAHERLQLALAARCVRRARAPVAVPEDLLDRRPVRCRSRREPRARLGSADRARLRSRSRARPPPATSGGRRAPGTPSTARAAPPPRARTSERARGTRPRTRASPRTRSRPWWATRAAATGGQPPPRARRRACRAASAAGTTSRAREGGVRPRGVADDATRKKLPLFVSGFPRCRQKSRQRGSSPRRAHGSLTQETAEKDLLSSAR
jgi:hypothetical protein